MSFPIKVILCSLLIFSLQFDHGTGLYSTYGLGWVADAYHSIMAPIYHLMPLAVYGFIFSFALALALTLPFRRYVKV